MYMYMQRWPFHVGGQQGDIGSQQGDIGSQQGDVGSVLKY